jgi:hypothetical protein
MASRWFEPGPLSETEVCLRGFARRLRALIPEARLRHPPGRLESLGVCQCRFRLGHSAIDGVWCSSLECVPAVPTPQSSPAFSGFLP